MDTIRINQILNDTAYERLGGRPEELKCAEYLQKCCKEIGLAAKLESFEVDLGDIHEAKLYIDGEEIPCKGFMKGFLQRFIKGFHDMKRFHDRVL